VETGIFAASKNAGDFRCPSNFLSSAQRDFIDILISGVPTSLPLATCSLPEKFVNPPLWLRVTFEPTKPILDAARIEYSLADSADASSAFLGAEVVAFSTLFAGSEHPDRKKQVVATTDKKTDHPNSRFCSNRRVGFVITLF
jgi:hypothetical protein